MEKKIDTLNNYALCVTADERMLLGSIIKFKRTYSYKNEKNGTINFVLIRNYNDVLFYGPKLHLLKY